MTSPQSTATAADPNPEKSGPNPGKSGKSNFPAHGFRRTTFDLTESLKNALALVAVHEDRPMVSIVEEALIQWMAGRGYEFVDQDGRIFPEKIAPNRSM